jgi:hypothetical protein
MMHWGHAGRKQLMVMSQHLPGGNEKNCEKSVRIASLGPRIKCGTY